MTDEEIERRLNEAEPSFIKNGGLLPPESGAAHLVTSGLDGDGPNRHLPRKPNENFGSGSAASSVPFPELNIRIRCLKDSGGVVSVATINLYGAEV